MYLINKQFNLTHVWVIALELKVFTTSHEIKDIIKCVQETINIDCLITTPVALQWGGRHLAVQLDCKWTDKIAKACLLTTRPFTVHKSYIVLQCILSINQSRQTDLLYYLLPLAHATLLTVHKQLTGCLIQKEVRENK